MLHMRRIDLFEMHAERAADENFIGRNISFGRLSVNGLTVMRRRFIACGARAKP
jgi:hypothetical protein